MWPKHYDDYPPDSPLVKFRVEPGAGITGCEMHEMNGWGHEHDLPKKEEKGLLGTLIMNIFGLFSRRKEKDDSERSPHVGH